MTAKTGLAANFNKSFNVQSGISDCVINLISKPEKEVEIWLPHLIKPATKDV